MRLLSKVVAFCALAAAALVVAGPAAAQQKLKWAHVYETSEPFHKWSVWAAQEIEKRTNGTLSHRRVPRVDASARNRTSTRG